MKRSSTEPDLMGWDKHARARLSQLRKQGVVAVRYVATCNSVELELLEHCIAKGQYDYDGYPGTAADKIIAENASEVYAKLPIGGAALSGSLKQGSALRVDYVLAGTQFIPARAVYSGSDLSGTANECARATHVVSTIYVGGFAFSRGASRNIQASATFFGLGAGGGRQQALEEHFEEGNPDACLKARTDGTFVPGCSVPLRLSLLPIVGRAQGECPIGTRRENDACVEVSQPKSVTPPKDTAQSSAPLTPPSNAANATSSPSMNDLPAPTDMGGMVKRVTDALRADQEGRFEDCIRNDRSALEFEDLPRTRLHLASCEARAGRLVDALKNSQRALSDGIRARDESLMKVARARTQELLDRIPHVTFQPGAGVGDLKVTFDDRPVPAEVLTKKFSIDPGKHEITMEGRTTSYFRRVVRIDVAERDFAVVPIEPDGQPVISKPPPR